MDATLLEIGKEIRRLKKEEPEKLSEIITSLNEKEAEQLYYTWDIWARENQLIKEPPDWPESIIIYSAGRGAGKDLDVNTPILTYNRGWTTMGQLIIGDKVFDEKGLPTTVVDKYYPEPRTLYEFEFTGGEKIVSSSEHEWVVCENISDAIRDDWVKLGKLKTTQEIVNNFTSYYIPLPKNLQFCKSCVDDESLCKTIINYKEVDYRPTCCIEVDSENHLFLAGKSLIATHNTRSGSEWVRKKATARSVQGALIGPTSADTRDVMVLGASGIIAVHPPKDKPKYEPSYARVVWNNRSVFKMYSGEKGDRVRGGNNEFIWMDELGAIEDRDIYDQALLTLRIGESRFLGTTTPRKGNEVMIELYKNAVFNNECPDPAKNVRIITGSTYENLENLSKPFMEQIVKKYEGTRLGQQEIEGQMLFDSEGALWSTETLDKCRTTTYPDIKLYAIGVDPQTSKSKKSDKTGIIGCGIDHDECGYVLNDLTGNFSPSEWSTRVVSLYDEYSKKGPCVIVVERNQGGNLTTEALSHVRKNLPIVTTFATQDKISRAMPVALLYEKGRVFHYGVFPDLEQEMVSYEGKGKSPDRLDAMVHAFNHLLNGVKNLTKITEIIL